MFPEIERFRYFKYTDTNKVIKYIKINTKIDKNEIAELFGIDSKALKSSSAKEYHESRKKGE